ncbi:MAG TPA: DUF1080 domain-containing protein [Pirellulales bacterium]
MKTRWQWAATTAAMLCGVLLFNVPTLPAEDAKLPAPDADGWITLFDGKTLDGWEINENPETFSVVDGTIKVNGERAHLFAPGEYEDFEFKADVMAKANSNSGMYFRAKFEKGWPAGYESQVNNSYTKDPIKTGSLYKFQNVTKQIIPDDTWWTERIVAKGNHIQIFVNDEKVVDFVDEKNTFMKGRLALQGHDPHSTVFFKNIKVKPLK